MVLTRIRLPHQDNFYPTENAPLSGRHEYINGLEWAPHTYFGVGCITRSHVDELMWPTIMSVYNAITAKYRLDNFNAIIRAKETRSPRSFGFTRWGFRWY